MTIHRDFEMYSLEEIEELLFTATNKDPLTHNQSITMKFNVYTLITGRAISKEFFEESLNAKILSESTLSIQTLKNNKKQNLIESGFIKKEC